MEVCSLVEVLHGREVIDPRRRLVVLDEDSISLGRAFEKTCHEKNYESVENQRPALTKRRNGAGRDRPWNALTGYPSTALSSIRSKTRTRELSAPLSTRRMLRLCARDYQISHENCHCSNGQRKLSTAEEEDILCGCLSLLQMQSLAAGK